MIDRFQTQLIEVLERGSLEHKAKVLHSVSLDLAHSIPLVVDRLGMTDIRYYEFEVLNLN